MIRLDRGKVTVPEDWLQRVADAFPDYKVFVKKASKFEKLPLSSAERRRGFKKYAPEVLPTKGQGKAADFPHIWGAAKDELGKMSYCKCSYCESMIGHRGDGQVEHFQPKSIFPLLAYVWLNYFLACGGCNRPKSNRWPEEGGYVRPDEGDPAQMFRFDENGEMRAVEQDGDAYRTVRDFRLNEEWLVQWRKVAIQDGLKELEDIIHIIYPIDKDVAQGQARRTLVRRSDPTLPYSAAVTHCLRRVWNAACPDVPL